LAKVREKLDASEASAVGVSVARGSVEELAKVCFLYVPARAPVWSADDDNAISRAIDNLPFAGGLDIYIWVTF